MENSSVKYEAGPLTQFCNSLVKAKLDSPTGGSKLRRKSAASTAEPTMTFHTRAATDEIYSIFNQPLKSERMASDDDTYQSDYYDEDDFTSTTETTGRVSAAASEFGEEEVTTLTSRTDDEDVVDDDDEGDVTKQSHWTEYDDDQDVTTSTATTTTTALAQPVDSEEVTVNSATSSGGHFNPYRDPEMVAQSHLPFMTPIVEVTETSLASAMSHAHNKKTTGTKATPAARNPDFFAQTPRIPEDEQTLRSPLRGISLKNDDDDNDDDAAAALNEENMVPRTKKKLSVFVDESSPSRQQAFIKQSPHVLGGKSTPLGPLSPVGSPGSRMIRSPLYPAAPTPESGSYKARGRGRDRDNNNNNKRKVIMNEKLCVPTDERIKYEILKKLDPPLSAWPGYVEHHGVRAEHVFSGIRKYIRALSRLSSKAEKQLARGPTLEFENAQRTYTIKRELGEGGFAPVYLAESVELVRGGSVGSFSSDGAGQRRSLEAIKIEEILNSSWEFHMLCLARHRLQQTSPEYARVADSITTAHELHCFQDEGFLVEDYEDQGTLVDLVNAVRNEPGGRADMGLDEAVAMFFTVELFRTLEGLHRCGVLHADIKPDNCLVRLDTTTEGNYDDEDDDSSMHTPDQYSSTGDGAWRHNGLKLIDFGRSIDTTVFPADVQFLADWQADAHECPQVREGRPWTHQIDLFGMAGVMHILLFGRYMEVMPVTPPPPSTGGGAGVSYRIKETLKRYWERELWADAFDLCLNPGHGQWMEMEMERREATMACGDSYDENMPLPPLASMRHVRRRMEEWLEQKSAKKGLLGQLRKLEALMVRKRRSEKIPER